MSREEHTCDICSREFEGYIVPIRDNFVDIVEWERRKERFKHLCKWCNHMYFQQDWRTKRALARNYSETESELWQDPRENNC